MSSPLVDINEAVLVAINNRRDNDPAWESKSHWAGTTGFVWSKTFKSKRTWMPRQSLQDFPDNGQVWVIGLASDTTPSQGRGNTCRKELGVQVAFQTKVQPGDDATIDLCVEMVEQLEEVCRREVDPGLDNFSWLRSEALSDEEGTPYSFMGLREGSFFEAYFTAFYNFVLA